MVRLQNEMKNGKVSSYEKSLRKLKVKKKIENKKWKSSQKNQIKLTIEELGKREIIAPPWYKSFNNSRTA